MNLINVPHGLPTEFLPADVATMRALCERILASSAPNIAENISELRDFAERERYREKGELDEYLLESPDTQMVCAQIQLLYNSNDCTAAASKYLDLYRSDMATLHNFHVNAALSCKSYQPSDWQFLWQTIVTLADRDNGHAMYLSSDNWPFSVFHKLIEELDTFFDPTDSALLAPLLTAGMQDPRTYVYEQFGGKMVGEPRGVFVNRMLELGNLMLPNGVMPVFAFEATTKSFALHRIKPDHELKEEYTVAVESAHERLPAHCQTRFHAVLEAYNRLYRARVAYDTYEYFGFYAFVRHFLILQCSATCFKDSQKSEAFRRAAATYQFGKARKLLNAI